MIIYHRADNDGRACGVIARRYFENNGWNATNVGWDFGDPPVELNPDDPHVMVLDLPLSCISGIDRDNGEVPPALLGKLFWIDHHASSIANDRWEGVMGRRIDGVAACRIAWQVLILRNGHPALEHFVDRRVVEPWLLRLLGEYDIWDKRDPDAEAANIGVSDWSLSDLEKVFFPASVDEQRDGDHAVAKAVADGHTIIKWRDHWAAENLKSSGFMREIFGVKFCVLVSVHARNSQFFPEHVIQEQFPETEAFMAVRLKGNGVIECSMYRREGHSPDILSIAHNYGGGGHRGACGCRVSSVELITWSTWTKVVLGA